MSGSTLSEILTCQKYKYTSFFYSLAPRQFRSAQHCGAVHKKYSYLFISERKPYNMRPFFATFSPLPVGGNGAPMCVFRSFLSMQYPKPLVS
jgi:hypothetical protein